MNNIIINNSYNRQERGWKQFYKSMMLWEKVSLTETVQVAAIDYFLFPSPIFIIKLILS